MSLQEAKKEYEKIENDKLSIVSIAKLVTYKNELEKMIGEMLDVLVEIYKSKTTIPVSYIVLYDLIEKATGQKIEEVIC